MPVVYPGQDTPAAGRSEKDLDGALEAEAEETAEAAEAEAEVISEEAQANADASADDIPTVEPVECETGVDCQLNRALEILADTTGYRQALADAGTAHAQ